MSRNHWLDRLLHSSSRAAPRDQPQLSVRHLERRRVLDGTAPAILISPTPTAEGDTVTVSADTGEVQSPQFDWTVTVDAVVIATSNEELFKFTPPDNETYNIDLVVTDGEEGEWTNSASLAVSNASPELTVVGDQTAQEGEQLIISDLGSLVDPGFDNPETGSVESFLYRVDWGDGRIDAGAATVDQVGSAGAPTLASFDGAHTYADNGVFTVEVTVVDDDGGSDTKTVQVTVGNVDPTLTVVGDQSVDEGELLSLTDLGQVSDPGFVNPALGNSETFLYRVDWGDGRIDAGAASIDQIGSQGVPTLASFDGDHIYADNGVYTVEVTVVDDDGGSDTKSFEVTVGNVPPTLVVPGDQMVLEGELLSLENIGQISDPGFVNPALSSSETFTYSIDWGDGAVVDMGAAAIDQVGSNGVPTLASFDGAHTYSSDGLYTVKVTVVDDDGGMTMDSFDVLVQDVSPTLTVAGDQTTNEGDLLSITNIGMVSDPAFSPEQGDVITYRIDWGDATVVDRGVATIDQLGEDGAPTLASFDGAHTYADNGLYTITITITIDNGDGGSDSGTLEVTVGNVKPTLTIVEDQTIDEGSLLSITNIGQISDPGFINLGLTTDETFTYSIDWGDGTVLDTGDATIDQLGEPGVPTLASFDGSHTYADNGVYTVEVTVTDDDGGNDTQSFDVTVGNVDPTLTVVEDQSVDEGSLLSITNIGQISDPAFASESLGNIKAFTYSIDWGDGTVLDTGGATIDQLGEPGVPTLASFDGSHTYADNGVYTVEITVTDDDGGMAVDTFMVEVGNVDPTLTVVEAQSVDEGSLLSITNLGQISDPGFINLGLTTDETFTYSIDWGDGTVLDTGGATIDQLGEPGIPTLASFDGAHTYADNGVYMVEVTVVDDDGGSDTQSFQVTVGNVDPTFTVVGDQTIDEGSLLSITNIGQISDLGFINLGLTTDETFTYSIDWGDGTVLDTGGATIDQLGEPGIPTLASFDGAHTYADNGVYTVEITVTDDDGGVDTQSFQVTVGNVDPTLTVVGDQTIDEGSLLSITNIGQISDPGFINLELTTDETFTYSIDWGDGTVLDTGGATIDQLGEPGVPTLASFDGAHTYADDGVYTVKVVVVDDDGGMAMDTFMVEVGNVDPTLTVVGDQTIDEGSLLSITNIGQISDPAFSSGPLGNIKDFSFSIDWGDGTVVDTGVPTLDQPGSEGSPTLASFDGAHTYADNGVYTVEVTVIDDNDGSDTQTFLVTVGNVAPQLTGVEAPFSLDEGEIFSLGALGVGLSDPGFDNQQNTLDASNGGETSETFTASAIDWGDGNVTTPVDVVDRVSGSPGELTTAAFSHAEHAYADNGTYTVRVDFADDDGGMVSQEFTIIVNNVAPTLTLTDEAFTINEGDTLTIPMLGAFTDPGFNNPDRPSGASSEIFSYEINWGDGTPLETGVLPVELTDGGQGVLTVGSLADSHLYADNDVDNSYTITVKLIDDDGGFDVESFDITVLNVAPTLMPVAAIDITSGGDTELTLTFTDPGADEFEVLVAWGENQDAPLEDRWVVETLHAGPTPATYVLTHTYDGPPNPDNITADVPISVVIRDDDFSTANTLVLGESNIETVLVGQPGTEEANFAIDTAPDIPIIEFPKLETLIASVDTTANNVEQTETNDIESRGGDASATSERYFRLHVVLPDGRMLEGIRLPDDAMDDLPALFARLPDNHYRIFLVRSENQSERLVLDVVVRNHRPIDPGDASDGTRDRPPTEDSGASQKLPAEGEPNQETPLGEIADPQSLAPPSEISPGQTDPTDTELVVADGIEIDHSEATPGVSRTARRAAAASALAAAALVIDPKTDWAVRLEREFARADHRQWRRLRRRRPR